ncbi:MAG: UvrD-helicase domain-containing protein, partial [Halieaceae bacterium]|nr:UvrD-helicase domain-containing protein [Halieaceae bacterium]
VDADDLAAALQRPHSQRRFHVVDDEAELQQMLDAPLEQWRVFLHPSQRKLVERDWNGPVRVLGGAGTGKTVVAMHRARWLVRNRLGPDERVLMTTYTRNLAMDIEANLRKICNTGEMGRIDVINIDALVSRFLKRENQPTNIKYPGDQAFDRCWDKALQFASGELDLPDSFYREEWERVVLPQRVNSQQEYFHASRIGRGVPLSRKQRASIWKVFEEARFQLHQ